ncbi:hypothetical protein BU103_11050 [Staphylococcus xylosus]|uniref:hypothetical protein n=1 Tax=Staphylococcus pseudoxylosus TaxID=2282419 RepID=UPI000D1DC518|nr:hypothetical protein [Staphylococcus pseudoxylosus]PTI57042.1 hypothetical protein BU103_11050 [Staphylococcus xylosus]
MVKIKRQVEMTHEEYAKYLIDKFGIASYERKLIDNNIFDAPMEFEQTFTLEFMRKEDDPVIERSFKGVVIEVEEEITEDTELDLVERFIGGTGSVCYTSHTMSINKCLRMAPDYINTTHFYIENDDRELVLIWRDGKLVE